MKTKEEITANVKTFITDLRIAIDQDNIRNIVQLVGDVENNPSIDLRALDNDLLKQFDKITRGAYNLI
ncbi:hypothetical protein [Labilibaculum sp.]|uniref:hypothetical protein n=1 Tax=Labilibaculum sp. TaxID=2060723 RepID=UPI002AA69B8C|nr:hypothetical protein [Labilibaculum sp.]